MIQEISMPNHKEYVSETTFSKSNVVRGNPHMLIIAFAENDIYICPIIGSLTIVTENTKSHQMS